MSKLAGSKVVKVKGGHAVYVSQPQAVASFIETAAKGVTRATEWENPGGLRITGTRDPATEAASGAATAPGQSRTDEGGTAPSGSGPGFLEWVSRLVHTHRQRLFRLARREGLRGEDALDCPQDAFHTYLLLPQARQLVESNVDSLRLLSVPVRNHARNRRRRHEIARPHHPGDEALAQVAAEDLTADKLIARPEDCALMIGCLETLGKLQRAVVTLRMLDEVAGEDVAAMLGLPPSHVAVLLHRAKQNLKSCMLSAGYRP